MLMPKRTKYRKQHRQSYEGKAKGNVELHFGEYGLVATEGTYITAQQIEAARIAMTRYMKRGGQVWINIVKVKVKVALNNGLLLLKKEKLCLKLVELLKKSQEKL